MKKLIFILLLVFVLPIIEPQYSFAGEKAKKTKSAKKAERKRRQKCRKTYQAYKNDKLWYNNKSSGR